jgi:glycosyltransferase involved in cell wall biosynthesis
MEHFMKLDLSIIIPVYNEESILDICYKNVESVLKSTGLKYEIIFIDDGSKDNSLNELEKISQIDSSVKIIALSRNFGKEPALTAGLDYSIGEAVIILDADLQDPPDLIPQMIKIWKDKKVDVVLMKRKIRNGETLVKKLSASIFYKLINALSNFDIPENVGDFRLMSRKAVDSMKKLPERNRYMKGLFAWIGMDSYTLEYDRDPRIAGTAKMNYVKLINLAIEGITSFSTTPLRIAIIFGIISAIFGFGFGFVIVFKTIFFAETVKGYPSTIALIAFLGGIQLFTIGIVGEYIGKIYLESKQRPNYLVKKFITKENNEKID